MVEFSRMQELRAKQQAYHVDDSEKMLLFMKGFCSHRDSPRPETLLALTYMREKHHNQTRASGEPYIVHPLSMACSAISMGLEEDELIAIILLHDVCEDTETSVNDLPFSDAVRQGVKYMTIQSLPGDIDKDETKRRYFWSLLENENALICKALDRYSNLTTMAGIFTTDRIEKNLRETHDWLLPVLKEGKNIYVKHANAIQSIYDKIRDFTDNTAISHGIDLWTTPEVPHTTATRGSAQDKSISLSPDKERSLVIRLLQHLLRP